MEDFFDQFKENLENRPPPSFEEKDWNKLQQKLDRLDQSTKRSRVGAWLLLPLLLLLLGSNGYWLYHWSNQTGQPAQTLIQIDTIWKHSVEYHTDTIYRTQVIYRNSPQSTSNNIVNTTRPPHRALNLLQWSMNNEDLLADHHFTRTIKTPYTIDQSIPPINFAYNKLFTLQDLSAATSTTSIDPADQFGRSPLLPGLNLPLLSEISLLSPDLDLIHYEEQHRKRTLGQQLQRLRPVGIMGGISIGGIQFVNELEEQKPAWTVGLHSAVLFSPKLRLWLHGVYTRNQFESREMNEAIGIPEVQAPTDDFVFTKAEARIPAFMIGAGMAYIFMPNRNWSPFCGIGYGMVSTLPYEVIYDFENPIANIEYNVDEEIEIRAVLSDFFIAKAGLETRFNKKWLGQFSLLYQNNWQDAGPQWRNSFQVNGKVLYQF